jgi:hypothetical protein
MSKFDDRVNRAFMQGFDRTQDVCGLVPHTQEGEAEIVGIFVASVMELAERWGVDSQQAVVTVRKVLG